MALNEQVRQALERLWHANRVLLAARQQEDAARAAREAAADLLRDREKACGLACQEVEAANERVWELARQAAEEEAG